MHRFGMLLGILAMGLAGADYSLCFLGAGPKSGTIDKAEAQELQKKHMAHIEATWKAGVLESAGPVGGLSGKRGIFLFSVSIDKAQEWAGKDPKVLAGDLSLECYLWEGPDKVGTHYREAYGRPGFAEKFAKYTGVLSDVAPQGKTMAQGKLKNAPWKYFSVVEGAAKEGTVFDWYHDPQVWPAKLKD
jgi:uncharacterized protein YciI